MSNDNRPATVAELIAHLQTLDPTLPLCRDIHSDNEAITPEQLKFMLPERVIRKGVDRFETVAPGFDPSREVHERWYNLPDDEICRKYDTSLDKLAWILVL